MSSRSELIARFPIVRYVPILDVGSYDLTSFPERLGESPVHNVYLEAHNARCDICLVDFDPPPSKKKSHTVTGIESDPLIQLPCSHVFHVSQMNSMEKQSLKIRFLQRGCIGNWLLETLQSTCPACRADVIQMERSGIQHIHSNRSVPTSQRPETHMEQSMGRVSASPSRTDHNSHSHDSLPLPPVLPSASSQNSLRLALRKPKYQLLANGKANLTFSQFVPSELLDSTFKTS
jgi:hypothetical protein